MTGRTLLAEGREAEVFLLDDDSVLKLMRESSYAGRVEREAAVLGVLADAGIAAPKLIGTTTVDGRPGLLTTRIDGDNLLNALGRRPWSVFTGGRVLGAVHAALNQVEAPAALPDLKDELRVRIGHAALPPELRERSLEVLDGLPPGDRLCHGDLHLGNVIGSWSAPAVIDWGDASRGDPIADFARTDLLQRLGDVPPGAPLLVRAFAPVGRSIIAARYSATYRKVHSIDADRFRRWRVVRAAARLAEPIPSEHPKLLAIVERELSA